MRICGRAVEIDPSYARAWALLAIAQSSLRYGFGCQVDDGFAAAHAALSIDPIIAEAHCPMARRLEEQRRFDEAQAEIEKALRLDPESWEVNREAARFAYGRRRIEEAAQFYEKTVSLMETDYHAWGMLSSCYQALGDTEGVMRAAKMMVSQSERVLAEDPSNGAALGIIAGGLATLGETDRAKEWMERALLIDPDNLNMRYNFACVLASHLREPDAKAALDLLEPLFSRMSGSLFRTALVDPDFDPIRDHPRFQAMLERAGKRLGVEVPNRDEAGSSAKAHPAA
jgi:adenylate cyclase